jgi:hypothetical protein
VGRLRVFLWWWVICCVVVGSVLTAVSLSVARARQKRPLHVRETGVVLVPVAHPGGPSAWRHIGAGVLVGRLGKVTATWPLVVLELVGGELTLRMRPQWLGTAFGVRPLRATANSEAVAFPARGWFRSLYVGIRTDHGEAYFWTANREAMLAMLESAGFRVTWAEQKITYP